MPSQLSRSGSDLVELLYLDESEVGVVAGHQEAVDVSRVGSLRKYAPLRGRGPGGSGISSSRVDDRSLSSWLQQPVSEVSLPLRTLFMYSSSPTCKNFIMKGLFHKETTILQLVLVP